MFPKPGPEEILEVILQELFFSSGPGQDVPSSWLYRYGQFPIVIILGSIVFQAATYASVLGFGQVVITNN